MRTSLLAVACLLVASGCAHTSETHESSVVAMGGMTAPPAPPQGEVIAVDQQVVQEEAPKARPRLTQTITLGQANNETTYSASPPVPGQGSQGGNNVTVNNNIVVNQPPAVYGGWGGYGGYGTYGYSRGGGYGVRADSFGSRGSSRGATWGNTGWEGARGRPAGPGGTPGVGGNWAPAPSFGPSQMR